ncbi:hypothetical protein LTS10_013097 [Elasticomyces elasticus]|nr:hypothetical protein LTS10_013097 [Elasticomyces elasticus]
MDCEDELWYHQTFAILTTILNTVGCIASGLTLFFLWKIMKRINEDNRRKAESLQNKSVEVLRADIARLKIVAEETSRDLRRLENELAKR